MDKGGAPSTGETADTGGDSDGSVDEGTWEVDDDGDGQAEVDGDCDDEEPGVYLGADEVVGDGIDQSCDASDAGPVTRLVQADATWTAAEPGLGAGWTLALTHAPDAAEGVDILVGAPKDYDDSANAAATGVPTVYRVSLADGAGGSLANAAAVLLGDADAVDFGKYMASCVDSDGDDYDDIVVGVPFGRQIEDVAYKGYSFSGPVTGEISRRDADWMLNTDSPTDSTGEGVTLVPETGAGDGRLVIGTAWQVDQVTGDVALYDGAARGVQETTDALARLTSEQTFDYAGYTVGTIGDMDGDGVADIAVSALQSSIGAADAGAVYIVPADLAETGSLADVRGAAFGTWPHEEVGMDVRAAGDMNGDGYADLVAGAHNTDEYAIRGGKAYLVLGPILARGSFADAEAMITPEASSEWLGWSVSTAGDFDADGHLDLAIGAPRDYYFPGYYPGKVYVYAGPVSGVISGSTANLVIAGEEPNSYAGRGLVGGEDLNGDGYDELVLGAPYSSNGGVASGEVYLFYGHGL